MSAGYFKMMSPQNSICFLRLETSPRWELFEKVQDRHGLCTLVSQSFLLRPLPRSQVSSAPMLKNRLEKLGSSSS